MQIKKEKNSGCKKVALGCGIFILGFFALFVISVIIVALEDDGGYDADTPETTEALFEYEYLYEDYEHVLIDTVSEQIVYTQHFWENYREEERKTAVRHSLKAYLASLQERDAFGPEQGIMIKYYPERNYFYYEAPRGVDIWTELYGYLYLNNTSRVDSVVYRLQSIADDHNLNAVDFARLIVSFVQFYPYETVEESYMGIYTPVEFLKKGSGDCDSRTVLLFTLLNKAGFDVAILNSTVYEHSMLGISIGAYGDYLEHNGKKYYFWETTDKWWDIGVLPKDFNVTDYWSVSISSDDYPI